jgi:hypothetical protein
MTEEESSPPMLYFKRSADARKRKRQRIVDLISRSPGGITRTELAAAIESATGCVSVMISQINKELIERGWKISSTDLESRPGRRGAPGRRYQLVRI